MSYFDQALAQCRHRLCVTRYKIMRYSYGFLPVLPVSLGMWWAILATALSVHTANVWVTGAAFVIATLAALAELSRLAADLKP